MGHIVFPFSRVVFRGPESLAQIASDISSLQFRCRLHRRARRFRVILFLVASGMGTMSSTRYEDRIVFLKRPQGRSAVQRALDGLAKPIVKIWLGLTLSAAQNAP